MLGVVDPLRSSRLWDLLHLSFFALVQSSEVEVADGALSYFNPTRIVHLLKFSALFCFKKGDRLVLPHSTDIIVTDSPVDLLCGH